MKNPSGYVVLRYGVRKRFGHRVAYELKNGPIPDGLLIRHTCDNPPCINPNHLLTGTHQDNCDDMMSRGRGRKAHGVSQWCSKLNDDAVREILCSKSLSIVQLAEKHGVKASVISKVQTGQIWKKTISKLGLAEYVKKPRIFKPVSEDQIEYILKNQDKTQQEIADYLGISQMYVSQVIRGKSRKGTIKSLGLDHLIRK